jgi:uncharacterized protein
MTAAPVLPVASTTLRPLGIDEVTLTGGFWAIRQQRNAAATLGHCCEWIERVGWVDNFRRAAEGRAHEHIGKPFTDSDVYKLLEALTWERGRSGSTEFEPFVERVTDLMAAVQEHDGYLNTKFGQQGSEHRYTNLERGHELYCAGHMMQAAVARLRVLGDDQLTGITRRVADHVCDEFAPGRREMVDGHPEVELGLVELYRATGEQRYLDRAKDFIDRRGHQTLGEIEYGREYFQDDIPIRKADRFRGHAVRALYLAAGAVDVALETGDRELLDAVVRQWENSIAEQTYLTGGMGSRHRDESFGAPYELPPDRAYAETCAGIASIMLCWRLLLATGDPRYADLAERTLFNIVAASPSVNGTAFFYVNTLHQRLPGQLPPSDAVSPRAAANLRAPWFNVSCCPTNIARTLASLAGYIATTDHDGLQLHQYASARIATTIGSGRRITIEVDTDYPWDGHITVRILETDGEPWTLSLRVPAWAENARIEQPDTARQAAPPGVAKLHRLWRPGDDVRMQLPVTPRWTYPDPRIDAARGSVAVERGPLVYCLESIDQIDLSLDELAADTSVIPADTTHENLPEPAVALSSAGHRWTADKGKWPYGRRHERPTDHDCSLTWIPYYLWGNRGLSTMRVWAPETSAGAD